MLWYDSRDRDEINAIIRRGIADIEAGRGRPAMEVMDELAEKYGLSRE